MLPDGYSASELLDVEDAEGRLDPIEVQAWEHSALEHGPDTEGQLRTSSAGVATSPGMMAPVTPLAEMFSDVQ